MARYRKDFVRQAKILMEQKPTRKKIADFFGVAIETIDLWRDKHKDFNEAVNFKNGRPTLWKTEYLDQAYQLCLLGCTNEQLADFFSVNIDTIYEWLKDAEFSDAVKKGKMLADSEVALTTFKRAKGYEYKEVKTSVGPEGTTITTTTKRIESDAANKLWLTNRQPDLWKDSRTIENTGEMSLKHTDLSTSSTEELIKRGQAAKNIEDNEATED